MASAVISLIGGAVINALAFTGGSYMFSKIDKNNSLIEIKRHNLATEKLNKDTLAYNEKRQNYLHYINNELHKQNISHRDFQTIDEAMLLYNSVTVNEKLCLPPKPTLSDYYKPSIEQRKYEYIWLIGGTAVVIFVAYKFVK